MQTSLLFPHRPFSSDIVTLDSLEIKRIATIQKPRKRYQGDGFDGGSDAHIARGLHLRQQRRINYTDENGLSVSCSPAQSRRHLEDFAAFVHHSRLQ